jgi:CheY-like chemotaxis protein
MILKKKKENLSKNVLIVDNEEYYLNLFSKIVKSIGYKPIVIDNVDEAISKIKNNLNYNLLIQDYSMYAKDVRENGGTLLAMVSKKINPNAKIILTSCWTPQARGNNDFDCILSKMGEESLKFNLEMYLQQYLNPELYEKRYLSRFKK